MPKKITIEGSNLITSTSDDWGGVNSHPETITVHGTAVPAKAEWGINRGEIERFLKEQLDSKSGEFYFDADTSRYLVFANADSRDLYLTNREEYADLLVGTFDAPANYTAEINVATPSTNTVLKGATGNYIDFTFDVKTRTGSSTGEAVIATFSFNNSGNIIKETRIYEAGTSVHFLVDDYLNTGANSISVTVTGRNTLASSMAAVTYTVVNLELSSNFIFSTPVDKGSYLHIPYTLKGSNVKYLEWYIDGVKLLDVDTVIGLNSNGTKNIDTTSITVGKHNIQCRAFITEGGTNYYSNTLYFDFLVRPSNGIWEDNVTYVLLGITIDTPLTSGVLSVNVKQYETFNYKVVVYDSRSRSLNLVITDNGDTIKSITIGDSSIIDESYSPTTTGNHTILLTCSGQTATFTSTVQSSDIGINEETSDLLLRLSAKGRSNNESNPAVWSFQQNLAQGGNNITTTFTGFTWNAKNGWNNDALIIPAGSNIEIGLNPLAGNPITKGRTIEIDFETSNIVDESASIISLQDGGTGLSVTATTARLQTAGGTKVETKFRDGDRVRLAFIINRTDDLDNLRMLYIVNNGILERASQFDVNDTIGIIGNTLTIGSDWCTVKLYSISVYDKPLQIDQAFQNYAINNPNIINIASFNDIYADGGAISVDKVNSHIPVMIITGDISSIMSISDKSHKNDWNTDPVNIEFRNMQNPEMNFFIDDADIRLQGTSSISYPRKNFRIYSKSKSKKYQTKLYTPTHNEEDLVANGKYSFKKNSAPVTCWCLKADFAESSGSHNTGIAKLWNSVMKNVVSGGDHILQTNAQKWAAQNGYPYDVRTTIDGFPIVLFQRDSENSPLVCLGQYNFNNDKSTEDVFGFTALSKEGVTPFDNSHIECWEVLDSDNSIALFTDISNFDSAWDNAFEARYPDKNTNVTALKSVCQFLNGCYDSANDAVDVATWRSGKANHFDLNKLAAYYVYLLRFGAVDQTVKNAMFTTEDGEHWFYINYDNDTVLGIDNESHQFDTWDYELFTRTLQGGYYYAGKGKSVLWRLFEADSECMELARQIDALLFSAGLTYEKVLEMFDDLQSGQWCERIYNENGRYKYVSQALAGKNVLHMLQGSRKSHRHWWLAHRFEKFDNVFGNGTYSIRSIQARSTGTVNIPQGAAYKYTPAITTYFGYAVASTTVDAPAEHEAGVEVTATGLPQETGVGNLIYIYNANNIGAIDLSAYISALGSLNIGDAIDVNGDSRLTKLVLGDGTNTNAYLTAISGLSTIKSLEEIDIRGYQAITNMDLSALVNLTTFDALNSGLTSFAPSNGISLTSAILPDTLQNLVLNSADVTSITYTPTTTLRKVELRNISGSWDAKGFVNSWLALLSDEQLANVELTLTGINWTNMTTAQAIAMGKVGTKNYQGKITLSSLTENEYNQLVGLYGTNVFNTNGAFVIDAPAQIFISGPSEIKEGNSRTFTATFFPVTEDTVKYLLYNGTTLIGAQVDQQGKAYRTYNGVTLYEDSGVMSVSSVDGDVSVKVRAQISGTETYSSYFDVVGRKITYPIEVIISGSSSINSNGMYNYTKALNGTYNADITNVTWTLSTNDASTLYSQDSNGATINVTNTPATSIEVTLTCTVTFEGDVTRTGTKTITLVLTFPSSISISGPASISDNGDYNYTKTFNESYTASLLSVGWALTANQNIIIKSSDDNEAVVSASQGNDVAVTLTLTCTCTFSGNVQRSGTKDISISTFEAPFIEYESVDLGLPSGLLWCKQNVKARSESDYGEYFSWGNTEGHAWDSGYNLDSTTYNNTSAASISTNLSLSQDAARANMGGIWRMPTKEEIQELYDNTDIEWVSNYNSTGVAGMKFMKKSDHSIYIFLPAAGQYLGTSPLYWGSYGNYWSASFSNSSRAYNLTFTSSDIYPQVTYVRYCGYSVRAVCMLPKTVDLDLPSGILWADRNIGAEREKDSGLYFSWGNTEGHAEGSGYNFNNSTYNNTSATSISTDLSLSQDAAQVNLGDNWRMPTKEETLELYNNTDITWVSNYNSTGVAGRKFMKKSDHNVYIFLPAAGYYSGTSLGNQGSYGNYWSASIYKSNPSHAYYLDFSSSNIDPRNHFNRYYGFPVRTVKELPKYIDLDLPSGTLWATGNIVSDGNGGYDIGNETDYGLYFSWGNTEGHAEGSGYNFDSTTYNSTSAASISTNLSLSQDAAHADLEGDWRMPTKEETKELYDNTDTEWVSNYNNTGVAGRKFMKKSDHNVYIFLPAAGCYDGTSTSLYDRGSSGFYWSASIYNSSEAYYSIFNDSVVVPQTYNSRYFGFSVRPVRQLPQEVDLGLSSGTLWANKNIGASSPEDYGLYFAWGETTGYKSPEDRNTKLTAETGTTYSGGFDQTSYDRTDGASGISGNLSGDNDAATVNLGSGWRMPTVEQWIELWDETDHESVTVNSISCFKLMKKSDHSIYILLPKASSVSSMNIWNNGIYAGFWNSAWSSDLKAGFADIRTDVAYPQGATERYKGATIRAVIQ